ncbi:GNAT family N-acetyltransferase [Brevundimonas sp. EYE_349]|uniref:GNAT family N-acetyltransferase n=2 Tax=Pseudomonadota TaxID=1224 RepID=UPI002004A050|nr:GNAT family N-acetyltransferase [Brevundimonas sp. EYE_349]MCK6105985.1 GNAT family N-acetyltransferase [Brevundimonas sp. EYE_349]
MAKFLLDTNILIPVEDARATPDSYASLLRDLQAKGHTSHIHEATLADIKRDPDVSRRSISLSKAAKYPHVKNSWRDAAALTKDFGEIRNDNDLSDAHILSALYDGIVDALITEDQGLHTRAHRRGLGQKVLTVRQALDFINGTYARIDYVLKSVSRIFCYELKPSDPIFGSLIEDYPPFAAWMEKCRKNDRECWVVEDDSSIAALVIFKDEASDETPEGVVGERVLKLCTFKVSERYRGGRLGEQLLRQAMCFAYDGGYDTTYLTVFPKQIALRELIQSFGFRNVSEQSNGELVYAKHWDRTQKLDASDAVRVRRNYPAWPSIFHNGLIVPVRPGYHDRLFPEAASRLADMPGDLFASAWSQGTPERSSPSNSIRKVYLGYTPTSEVAPGTLIAFYRSSDNETGVKSAIAAVGIAERYDHIADYEQAVTIVAKRSVYTNEELESLVRKPGLKALTFLFYGYLKEPLQRKDVEGRGLLDGPPQSFVGVSGNRLKLLEQIVRGNLEAA